MERMSQSPEDRDVFQVEVFISRDVVTDKRVLPELDYVAGQIYHVSRFTSRLGHFMFVAANFSIPGLQNSRLYLYVTQKHIEHLFSFLN
jgi:hypothetical protein